MFFKLIIGITIVSSIATFLLLFGDSPSFRNTPIQKLRNGLVSVSKDLFQFYTWLDDKANGQLLKILNWMVPVGYMFVVTFCFHLAWSMLQQYWVHVVIQEVLITQTWKIINIPLTNWYSLTTRRVQHARSLNQLVQNIVLFVIIVTYYMIIIVFG